MNNSKDNLSEQNPDRLIRQLSILRVLVAILTDIVIVGGLGAGYCGYKLCRKIQGQ